MLSPSMASASLYRCALFTTATFAASAWKAACLRTQIRVAGRA